MALTKLSTDVIDLSGNTEALLIPKGTSNSTASVEYLVVAGGGGGAGNSSGGGGGGAGGLLTATADFAISAALDISVGVGGAGTTNETSGAVGVNGGDSIFSTITATGGGGAKNTGSGGSSSDGGSGGGASGGTSVGAGSANPTGQGNNGGIGSNPSDIGGGGGGAGGVGQPGGNRSGSTDGQGGAAISNSIAGTSLLYAGGGGGGVCDFTYNSTPATAGLGGAGVFGTGGNGGQSGDQGTDPYTADGGVGVTNTGGGGGGGSRSAGGTNANGGAGGSGVVILRYPTANPITISSGLYGNYDYGTIGQCHYPVTATALYRLENAMSDTCGTYSGTSTSSPSYSNTAPKYGTYNAVFNGTSNYISTGINFSTLTNAKSISMWIKSTGSSSIGFGGMDGSSANNGLFSFDESAGNVAYIPVFGGYHTGDASTVVTNQWNHFVVTDTNVNGNVKIYINGSEVVVTKLNSSSYVNNTNMQIGKQMRNTGTAFFQTGSIDQIRIFPSELDADQVQALYSETNEATTGTIGTETWSQFIAGTGTVSFSGTGTGRPSSPTEGLMRENTTTSKMEFYDGSLWQEITDTASTYSNSVIPSANFNTVIYSNPGLSTPISVGFGPDMVLFKERNGINSWQLYDTVRGDDYALYTNDSQAQYNYSTHPNGDLSPTITSTGFTTPPVTNNGINNSSNFVSYSWKAGGAAVSNTDGTITSQVSANVDAGFSIVEWTDPSDNSTYTVGHGLSSAPELIITKETNDTGSWLVFVNGITSINQYLLLNSTGTTGTLANVWGAALPNSTTFGLKSGQSITLGKNVIAYCFHSVAGYSKIGFYVGNGSTTGPEIYTGFKPAFIIMKKTNATSNWYIHDNKRNGSSGNVDGILFANLSDAEDTTYNYIDFTSTGFVLKFTNSDYNTNGGTYIYMAIAE